MLRWSAPFVSRNLTNKRTFFSGARWHSHLLSSKHRYHKYAEGTKGVVNLTADGPEKVGLFVASVAVSLLTIYKTDPPSFSSNLTHCGNNDDPMSDDHAVSAPNRHNNPLWPSGVSSEMVDRYVNEILDDRSVNITAIPDSIERIIYATTVRLTLNIVYRFIGNIHGIQVLGQHLELERADKSTQASTSGGDSKRGSSLIRSRGIDNDALEVVATELLANKSINQRWIPDVVEKQIYQNCLKLIFRLLDSIADTLAIRLCGHELKLSFEPLSEEKAKSLVESSVKNGHHSPNLDEDMLDALVAEAVKTSEKTVGTSNWRYAPLYHSFVIELHKTLYCLIVGLLDDILSKLELVVLDESIKIKIVANNAQSASSQP